MKVLFSRLSNSKTFQTGNKPEPTNIETSTSQLKHNRIGHRNNTKSVEESGGLQFLDIPKGDDTRIQNARLDEEYLLFEVFSKLMAYLQPSGFSSDLLREVLHNRISTRLLAFQIIKIDFIVIIWILFWGSASICLSIAVISKVCCSKNIRRLDEDFSIGPVSSREKCSGQIMGISLHILLLLLVSPIILILAGNEQISRSISKSPASATLIYEDINTFLSNTHMQISFVVTSSTDIAIGEIRKDLEAINDLFGKAYQQELSAETGIDMALIELDDLEASASQVTSLVSELMNDCAAARIAATLLQDQLDDIARQLTISRQQCTSKDRPLCYTLQYHGFETSFTVDNLTNDSKIRHLHHLATEENFNGSIDGARKTFAGVPEQTSSEAEKYITDLKSVLSRKRTEVYKSTHALDVLTRSLSETLAVGRESSSSLLQRIADWDLWRWLAVLGLVSILCLTWGLLLCGAPCGCGLTSRTIPLLLSGVSVSCIICLLAWGAGSLSLLIAGHAQSVICDPLYDHPHYGVLGKLLDSGGILYEDGLLEEFAVGNDTVRVADVLKNCQRNQAAYHTFHLYNTINIEEIINYHNWKDLANITSSIATRECSLEILGPALQLSLQGLSTASVVNLTSPRLQASAPVTKRDLSSFADQLNTVARQLTDAASARRIDNLAFSVRKVVQHEVQSLNQIKDAILYKLTTLEVLLPPLHRLADRSLLNLKGIQYFLNNQGQGVKDRVLERFTQRIESYLEDLYTYVNETVTKNLGKCRPIWDIFHFGRFQICKLIVDPMLGIALFCFFAILLLLTIAPIVIKLVDYYREDYQDSLSPMSHRNDLIIDDDGVWMTPSSESPPGIQLRECTPPEERELPSSSAWASPTPPRQPSPRRIPPPPR
ncbi:hypothetical protein JTB14_026552 [Gonioctena quinquepunctata]|nr:hypothetical protein JTB14_026552 [Gonioctena quinquepunctata]